MHRRDQGIQKDRYLMTPRVLIFLIREDRVLLLKGDPQKRLWANFYNGIGGHIEVGEGVLAAARRELEEETGLTAPDLRLCGTVTVDSGENPGVGIYVCKGEQSIGELRSSPEGSLDWVPTHRLADLPLVEDLPILLPRVLAIHPGDPPFSAHYYYNDEDQLVVSFD